MAAAAQPTRIVILGGGFAGLYAAQELERRLGRSSSVEVTLINRDNFFLFTPMLHEVAASDLDLNDIVVPLRSMLRHTVFFAGEVAQIDVAARRLVVAHGSDGHRHTLPFDHLVVALGSVTNFHGLPGLERHALTMKTLGDAIHLRNRLIAHLEEADTECAAAIRDPLMTFVVSGGGFAGVETIAGINDFVREALRFYPNIPPASVRMILVHSGAVILPELGEELGRYAHRKLAERGVEIVTNARVASASDTEVRLNDGRVIVSRTLVWTAGTSAHPLVAALPCPTDHGRLQVDEFLRVPGWPGLWALGDCAVVPDRGSGRAHPPTAQHALREGRTVARNIEATLRGAPLKPFEFATLGQLAAIGRRTGVAKILGVTFSGFFAWWLWRSIYLSKLPRFDRKVRVAIDWTLDLIFEKDLVQYLTTRAPVMSVPTNDLPADVASRPGVPAPQAAPLVHGPA